MSLFIVCQPEEQNMLRVVNYD
eukprot:UN17807